MKFRMTVSAVFAAISFTFAAMVSAETPTDIEKFFTSSNYADFTGAYTFSGINADSTTYSATAKLSKWNSFTTQRGKMIQTFKAELDYGSGKSNGVAVFDGKRLYYAVGKGGNQNFYLALLSRLVLDDVALASIMQFEKMEWELLGSGKVAQWKGKSPWYGYFGAQKPVDAFGYYFRMKDGEWGECRFRETGFPSVEDTGSYQLLELKKNGEHDDKRDSYRRNYDESGGIVLKTLGENINLIMMDYDDDIKGYREDYWGTGLFVADPAVGDSLLMCMVGGPDITSFGWLEIVDGNLTGISTWVGGDVRCTETWVVPDEVKQKNPGLFK